MPVRRRAATRWDVNIDQAISCGCVFAGKERGVGVSDQSDVRQVRVVGLSADEIPIGIVGRNGGSAADWGRWLLIL